MGKIGDLVNRIISPLLNRSTDSQTVADPRRGRIGYVGNITLISQLINDVGYTTSEGTVTNVDIRAGKFEGWQDIAPASDELIPKFNVPTSTSDLTNNGSGGSSLPYGTGTITGLKRTKINGEDIGGVTISGNTATVTINWKNDENYYENDRGYTKNLGNLKTLHADPGEPAGGLNPETGYCLIKIPTHTSHLVNNTYIASNNTDLVKINTTTSITITTTKNIFRPATNSPLNQEQLNSFKLYRCGNMYTFFGDYYQHIPKNNPGYIPLFISANGPTPGFTNNNYIVIGNGIAKWNNGNYDRATPVVIVLNQEENKAEAEIGMFICNLSTGTGNNDFDEDLNYHIYISGTIFSTRSVT